MSRKVRQPTSQVVKGAPVPLKNEVAEATQRPAVELFQREIPIDPALLQLDAQNARHRCPTGHPALWKPQETPTGFKFEHVPDFQMLKLFVPPMHERLPLQNVNARSGSGFPGSHNYLHQHVAPYSPAHLPDSYPDAAERSLLLPQCFSGPCSEQDLSIASSNPSSSSKGTGAGINRGRGRESTNGRRSFTFSAANDYTSPSARADPGTRQKCPFSGCCAMVIKGLQATQHVRTTHREFCDKSRRKVTRPILGCGDNIQACNYTKHFLKHLGGTPCKRGCGAFLARTTKFEMGRHEAVCARRLAKKRKAALQDTTAQTLHVGAVLHLTQVVPGALPGMYTFQLYWSNLTLAPLPGIPTQGLHLGVPSWSAQSSTEPLEGSTASGAPASAASQDLLVLRIRLNPSGLSNKPAATSQATPGQVAGPIIPFTDGAKTASTSAIHPATTSIRRSSRLQDKAPSSTDVLAPIEAATEQLPAIPTATHGTHSAKRRRANDAQEFNPETPKKKNRRQ